MKLKNSVLIVEKEAYEGVRRVADKVADDVQKVTGIKPAIVQYVLKEGKEQYTDISKLSALCQKQLIVCVTLDKSPLLQSMIESGIVDRKVADAIRGKRETFAIRLLTVGGMTDSLSKAGLPEDTEELLLICGSDKLGTIYGMFTFSEYIGVSPLCYWGDAAPLNKEDMMIEKDIEQTSKEPSVKYRGFFINDEWPCFGNWTFHHFGGFTAEMYDHVFEFLLRMKGNYLWPAMWTSSFPLDGPGSLNEELADIYGITVAYSHHEPCLRASEEWDKVRGEGTRYGNEWNYYTNAEGLSNYWADALKRSGKYNHMITIGMRGERDSSMLGPEATLGDNIELLKNIITKQRQLIGEYVNSDVDSVPQLLALYKEVEAYFYGDENTQGLDSWDELENVIFMLCEDNFGHMRTLPTEKMRSHKGGYGMYYHFDYHGGPVSYEWMPSTTLALTWEQMTQAYDYGIRDVWIVNVGDLKGNEIALQYFLTLAYDFDTWGSSAPNSWKEYLKKWAKQTFPEAGDEVQVKMACLYKEFVALNATRKPEALHSMIYHPSHYHETDRMLNWAERIETLNEEINKELENADTKTKEAFYSLLYYPAKTSINLIRMHLYAGKNEYYARQGRPVANKYGQLLAECIERDRNLSAEFGSFKDGKWKGMELEEHIGFTSWNDDGWKYPVRMYVEPVTKARMSVSRADCEELYLKVYGEPRCIRIDDFVSAGVEEVVLEISNDGIGSLAYEISVVDGQMPKWLQVSPLKGTVEVLQNVVLKCDRTKLNAQKEAVRLMITDGDTRVAVLIEAQKQPTQDLPKGTYLPHNGVIVINADHFCEKKGAKGATFETLEEYGRSGCGMKVFPSTVSFKEEDDKPELIYSALLPKEDEYRIELWMTPTNSLENRRTLRVECSAEQNGSIINRQLLTVLDENYRGGENSCPEWCRGVLDQIRIVKTSMKCREGIVRIHVGAMEAGMVLERVLIYPADQKLPASYLGPEESFCC